MKSKTVHFQNEYRLLLGKHLRGQSELQGARGFGGRSVTAGMEMLDIVKFHEQSMSMEAPSLGPGIRLGELVKRAGQFFSEVVAPLREEHPASHKTASRLKRLIQTLDRRTLELAVSEHELEKEIAHRARIQAALEQSQSYNAEALEQSGHLQEQLRYLSREILSAQEEERKRISRELHDQVASSLNGISLELGVLRKTALGKNRVQNRKIARAQRLVRKSVDIIHTFARELRPPLLDDLGLVPALHSLFRTLFKQSGLRVRFEASEPMARLDSQAQTVLYRVAQEALTNVMRHAGTKRVAVSLTSGEDSLSIEIRDHGKSFRVDPLLYRPGRQRRLGLLGMRERVEMVGGSFCVTSTPGKGTTVSARIPSRPNRGNGQPRAGEPGAKTGAFGRDL